MLAVFVFTPMYFVLRSSAQLRSLQPPHLIPSPCHTWSVQYWTLLCYSFLRSQPVSCFEGSAQKIAQFPKGTLPLHTLRYKALTQIAHSILAHTVVFRFCALSNCAVWGEVRKCVANNLMSTQPPVKLALGVSQWDHFGPHAKALSQRPGLDSLI